MKKLNITGEEYKHRTRQQAKARTAKFREEQERRGYKNLTAYLSKPFRDELERLSTDQGLNRQDAMDHIFNIYQHAINDNAKSYEINNVTSDVIKENELDLFGNDQTGPDQEQDHADYLFTEIDRMKREGKSSAKIGEFFNSQNVLTASGGKFGRSTADAFYKARLKAQGLRWNKNTKKSEPITEERENGTKS